MLGCVRIAQAWVLDSMGTFGSLGKFDAVGTFASLATIDNMGILGSVCAGGTLLYCRWYVSHPRYLTAAHLTHPTSVQLS